MPTARLGCVARVLVLPWIDICLLVVLAENTPRSNSRGVPGEISLYCPQLRSRCLNDLFFGLQAWLKLHTRFRRVATERFDRKARGPSLHKSETTGANRPEQLPLPVEGKCFAQIGLGFVQRGFLGLPRLAQFGDLGLDLVRSGFVVKRFLQRLDFGVRLSAAAITIGVGIGLITASVTAAATSTATPSAWETETAHAHARVPLGIHDLAINGSMFFQSSSLLTSRRSR